MRPGRGRASRHGIGAAAEGGGRSCGVVDEPFGPARALRGVWTSRGRGWRLAHRIDHTRGLLAHRLHRTNRNNNPFNMDLKKGLRGDNPEPETEKEIRSPNTA